jgi:hypothetical protein
MFIPFANFQTISQIQPTPGLTALDYGRFVVTKIVPTSNPAPMWSNDGINWNIATIAPTTLYRSCEFSPELGLYVLGSNTTTTPSIITSTNGVTWTTRTVSEAVINITWCSTWNKFIAIGRTQLHLSTDGVNWNATFSHGLTTSLTLISYRGGQFITYSQMGTSSSGNSIYFGSAGANTSVLGSQWVFYSEDGLNFKTYSINSMSKAITVGHTRYESKDVFFGQESSNSATQIGVTGSINATGSATWNRLTITSGTTRNIAASSINSDLETAPVVLARDSGTTAFTTPLAYKDFLNPNQTVNGFTNITLPSAAYRFRDVIYCRALQKWVAIQLLPTSSVNAYWTCDSVGPTASPTTWTVRSFPTNGQNAEIIKFGEGVRTTGYRVGSSIT